MHLFPYVFLHILKKLLGKLIISNTETGIQQILSSSYQIEASCVINVSL